jgi:hypothetical protein
MDSDWDVLKRSSSGPLSTDGTILVWLGLASVYWLHVQKKNKRARESDGAPSRSTNIAGATRDGEIQYSSAHDSRSWVSGLERGVTLCSTTKIPWDSCTGNIHAPKASQVAQHCATEGPGSAVIGPGESSGTGSA